MLRVRTVFPGGNAGHVVVATRRPLTEVHFHPDPHGGPETLWFHLRLESPRPPRVRLVLDNPDNMLGGHRPENFRPVLRTATGDWHRLGPGTVTTLADGRREVAWDLPAWRRWVECAFCYPYGRAELAALLHDTASYWHADVIGLTPGGRPLVRLSNQPGTPGGRRPGLYLIARQHSGETPGSWVLDGFLRALADHREQRAVVWAVPLTNLDGVEQGDYGKDNFPYDLNRAWDSPPMRHETLVMQRDLHRWAARCRPVLALDFHAPGAAEDTGVYCYVPNPKTEPRAARATRRWAKMVAAGLGPAYAAAEFARVAHYRSRWNSATFRQYVWRAFAVPVLSLEISYALAGQTVLTREHYRDAGRRLAAAVLENWPS
jgi:hypothetical protein